MSVTVNRVNQNLQITRGDSCQFILRDGQTKEPYEFESTDTVKLTVKTQVEGTLIFQKIITPDVNGHVLITIDAADTESVDFGKYVYDIEWSTLSGKVTTIIPKSGRTRFVPTFEVCEEVTLGV